MTRGVGSPIYMAPEMLRGDKKYTRAVDVYSFGIMCVELWNQRIPYSELQFDSSIAFAMAVSEGTRPEIDSDCPAGLLSMIHQCISSERQERPTFTDSMQTLEAVVKETSETMGGGEEHVKARHGNDVNQASAKTGKGSARTMKRTTTRTRTRESGANSLVFTQNDSIGLDDFAA